jgi:hypothetical protein
MKGQKQDQHQLNNLSLAKADPSPGIAKCFHIIPNFTTIVCLLDCKPS